MKTTVNVYRRLSATLITAAALALAAGTAQASNYTNSASGNWTVSGSWPSSGAPVSTTDGNNVIVFNPTATDNSTNDNAGVFWLNQLLVVPNYAVNLYAPGGNSLLFTNTTGGALPVLTNAGSSTLTLNSAIALATNLTLGAVGNITLASNITDGALGYGVTKSGAGTLTLSSTNNAFGGPVVVAAGTLVISGGGALKNTSGNITVASGSVLNVDGAYKYINVTNAITLSGGGIGTSGALNFGNNQSFSGPITLLADSRITFSANCGVNGTITAGNKNLELYMNGSTYKTDFSGGINLGTGVLTLNSVSGGDGANGYAIGLNAANTYSGGTVLTNYATVRLGNAGALGSGVVTLYPNTRLELNTYSPTIGGLSGTGGSLTDRGAAGTTTVTVAQSGNTTFAGVVSNGASRVLALTKSGAGTLTLSGINTYTGPTTVNGGALVGGAGGGCLNSAVSVANGATNGVQVLVYGAQWTCAGLTYTGGAPCLTFDMTTVRASASVPPLQIVGDLNVTGTVSVAVTNGYWPSTGTYPLAAYTGNLNGPGAFSLAGVPAGVSATLNNNTGAKRIELVVTAVPTVSQPVSTWTNLVSGNASGAWGTDANWSNGVPNAADAVADFSTLDITATSYVNNDTPRTVGALRFADTVASHNWYLTNSALTLATSLGQPTITVSNRTATISAGLTGTQGFYKDGGGQLTISSSGNTLSGPMVVGAGTLYITGGSALLNTPGSITVISGSVLSMGSYDIAASNTMYLSGSGSGTSGALSLGSNQGLYGPITLLADSRITFSANCGVNGTITAGNKNLELYMNGSTYKTDFSGGINLGTGVLTLNSVSGGDIQNGYAIGLNAANTYSGGTVLTNYATVRLGNAGALGSGVVTLYPNTRLELNTYSPTVGGLSGTGGSITDRGAAGTTTLTVVQSSTTTFAGVISNGVTRVLALTKSGAGTLALSGTNTYSGPTTLSAGELVGVTGGSCSNSSLAVSAGATNGVQVATVGGQWVCSNLTYASGAYLDINFGSVYPSTTIAPLLINGNLTNNGTLNVIVRSSTGIGVGTYPLLKYTGVTNGALPTAAVSLPSGMAASLANNSAGQSLDLVVTTAGTGVPLQWAVGNQTWDTTTANWKDPNGSAAKYLDADPVTFDDTASGSTPITVTLNTTVNPASVTANLTNKDYTISGSGAIAGATALTKSGTGRTLTLTGANTFTGSTTISAGTLVIGGAGLLGNGTYATNIVNNGAFTYASSATQTLGGAISGTGSLTNSGAGTLILATANTYSGATTISAGELVGVTGGSCSNSAVTVASGATNGVQVATAGGQWTCTNLTSQADSVMDFNFNNLTPSNTVAPLNVLNNLAFTNAAVIVRNVSGGSLAAGQYRLVKYAGTFSGTVTNSALSLPSVTLGAGTNAYLLNNTGNKSIDLLVTPSTNLTWAAGNGNWDILTTTNWAHGGVGGFYYADGCAVMLDNTANGSSPILVTNTVAVSPASVVVNATKDYRISGSAIAGNARLTKSGTGTLILATNNTYSGGTTVNGGVLGLGHTNALGTGELTWQADASGVLSNTASLSSGGGVTNGVNLVSNMMVNTTGNNLLLGGTITNNGALTKAGSGTLILSGANTFSGATTNNTGGTLQIGDGTTATATAGTGALTNAGTLTLNLNAAATLGNSTVYSSGTIQNTGAGKVTITNSAALAGTINGGTAGIVLATKVTSDFNAVGDITWSFNSVNLLPDTAGTTWHISANSSCWQFGGSAANPLTLDIASGVTVSAAAGQGGLGHYFNNLTGAGNFSAVGNGGTIPNYFVLGTSTLGGTLTVGNNGLSFGNGGATGTAGATTIANGSSVTFNCTTDNTYAGAMSGVGTLIKSNSNTVALSGSNTFTGPTMIGAGTLAITGAGQLGGGAYAGVITDNGSLLYGSSAAQTLSGVISGTGSLTKTNSSTLTLSGINTYSGPTAVNGGALMGGTGGGCLNSAVSVADGATNGIKAMADNSQWTCAGLTYTGGAACLVFDLAAFSVSLTVPPLQVAGDLNVTGTVSVVVTNGYWLAAGTYPLAGYTGTLNGPGAFNLVGLPAGMSATLVSNTGARRLDLNVTAVPTAIQTVSAWTNLVSGNASGAWSAAANWSNGVPNAADAVADFSSLNITATSYIDNDASHTVGALRFADTVASHNWYLTNATLTLTASAGQPTITVGNNTAEISAGLTGTQGFYKDGGGTLTMSGGASNTIRGPIIVNAGTLISYGGNSLTNTSGSITVASAAELLIGNTYAAGTVSNALYLSGTGINGSGALSLNDNQTIGGPITLLADSRITFANNCSVNGTITAANKNLELYMNGSQYKTDFSGGINLGTGALTLNSVSGGDIQNGYAIGLNAANTYSGGTVLTNYATVRLGNAGALGSGGVTFYPNTRLELNTYSPTIGGLSGTGGSITDRGAAGTTTLTVAQSGNTTYAGVISNGATRVLALTKSGAGALTLSGTNTYTGVTTISNGTLQLGDGAARNGVVAGAISNNATLTIANPVDQTVTNLISGTGALVKVGSGTLVLTNVNTYTGGTTLNAGTLVANAANAVGTGLLTVNGGALSNSASCTLMNTVNLSSDAYVGVSAASTLTLSGVVTNGGGLAKSGAGTLALTGVNTFGGETTVAEGTMAVVSLGASSFIAVSNAASLVISNNNTIASAAEVHLALNASMNLANPGTNTVWRLYIGGVQQCRGRWGRGGNPKAFWTCSQFSGDGVLLVTDGPDAGSVYKIR